MDNENMILMAYDECGDEYRVEGFHVSTEILEDEDMLEAWKMIKESRTEIPEECHGLHWINTYEMKKEINRMIIEDMFY